jgi:hypothetical protein
MHRPTLFSTLALAAMLLPGCGGDGGSSTPQAPSSPAATPTPAPTPTPNPFAAACGQPLPRLEDAYGYKIKVQSEPSPNRKWLTASPLVHGEEYCAAAGLGGRYCATRNELDSSRPACDHFMSGLSDEGRPGPNWYHEVDGVRHKCGTTTTTGASSFCATRDESQYNLNIYGPGKYVACAPATGTCGVCVILTSDWGVVHRSPAGLCKSGD